ncbi:MAG TPA: hypothetical protein VF071_11465 [Candidatus Limnocylindria bacterium]
MGGWRPRGTHARLGPLHLLVERYVHCPRGGLAPLSRCEACDLMQGMLLGDRLEVLCAYPETVPALRPSATWDQMNGTQGSSTPSAAGERRDAALALATPQRSRSRRRAAPRARASLIFERDWPDD